MTHTVLTHENTVIDGSRRLIYEMVYVDKESNWGHRDSLLDSCSNYTDIAVAWNSRQFYLNITMIAKWIQWEVRPVIYQGKFYIKGRMSVMRPYLILIYRDNPNPNYVPRDYYTIGDLLAGVVPRGYMYWEIYTITAERFKLDKQFEVLFPLPIPAYKNELYTVVMIAEDPRGIEWEPLTKRQVGKCVVLEYIIM